VLESRGLKLPVPQRREVVAELAETGMSNRAIAEVIGVHRDTVNEDVKKLGGGNPPPVEVTGQDGKTYPRPQPKPVEPQLDGEIVDAEIVDAPEPSPPRRKPLVDSAREIGLDLAKLVRRLEEFGVDDRIALTPGQRRDSLGPETRVLRSAFGERP
jgi:hypothetical protein